MQGHEDDTILKFFPSGFMCHDGPYQVLEEKINQIKTNGCLYKIQGPFGETPQAIQQDQIKCEKLNSNDAFFVVASGGDACFYWLGGGASDDEQAYSKKLADMLAPNASVKTGFKEGEETEEFWGCLGGKTEYLSTKDLGFAPGFEPRLFNCSTS